MFIFDTHTHYTDARFDDDRDALLSALSSSYVCGITDCACNEDEWARVSALSARHALVYSALGFHGLNATETTPNWQDRLKAAILADRKCVAIGEIGIDYHYEAETKELQKRIFADQLEMAVQLDMPVIVHDREAHRDVADALLAHRGKLRGVLHCYSGSAEMVRELADLDFYYGFGGSLTFKNNEKGKRAALAVPLDRLLIETDCPYLAPVPFRGRRNDSSLLIHVVALLSEILGLSREDVARITTENARRLFGIDESGAVKGRLP